MADETAGQQQAPATPPIDPAAYQALQAEAAGYRALTAQLLGRELKQTDSPSALAQELAQQRAAAAERQANLRIGLAETLLGSGLQVTTDLDYLRHRISTSPEFAESVEKNDWKSVLGKAAEMGLVRKAEQVPVVSIPPPSVRPASTAPTQQPDEFPHVKSVSDLRGLSASQLMKFKSQSPDRYRQLTQ